MLHEIAITQIDKVGACTATALIDTFGSAEAVLTASHSELLDMELSVTIADSIIKNRDVALAVAHNIVEQCNRSGIRVLVRGTDNFPALLGECRDSPQILYVRGNIDFNSGKWLSIVGTRKATQNGIATTTTLVEDLGKSYDDAVVVSGLAFGIDKAAHTAALQYGIPTVAVMAGWVDDIVPASHFGLARQILHSGGAIISDMPPGTVIRGSNFLSRNRLIAGISHCTIVVESAAKGGSLVTADIALSYDRELFALPGRIEDTEHQGTNQLIKSNKAILYQDLSDIAQIMGWVRCSFHQQNPSQLADYLRITFSAIPDNELFTLDAICESLEISISEASSRMLQLEVLGFVKSIQGRMYQKARF